MSRTQAIQVRQWGRRIAKGAAIAVGVYVAAQIAMVLFLLAAFTFGDFSF